VIGHVANFVEGTGISTDFFNAPGQFWKGNLHTHSTLSDGVLEPEEVCRRYREEGYDFVALTDHFIGLYDYPIADTKRFRTNSFTTILGAEVHSGALENGELWHLVAVGLPEDFPWPNAPHFRPVEGQESGPSLAQRALEAGAFVAIAHPHWSSLSMADAMSIKAAHAVEVYNHGCDVDSDRGSGWHLMDMMLSAGRRVTAIATDDAHFATHDHFGGWVRVKAEENEPKALVAALKAGAFHATQGPDLNGIEVADGEVIVRSSPVRSVIVQGQGYGTVAAHGEGMTETRVSLRRFGDGYEPTPWIRISVIDAAGKRGWSNPIWL